MITGSFYTYHWIHFTSANASFLWYDTIWQKSLTWIQKLNIQLNLAYAARKKIKKKKLKQTNVSAPLIQNRLRSEGCVDSLLWLTKMIKQQMYDYYPRERKRLTSLQFLADRTNGRAYATVLRLSVVVCECDVMYWREGSTWNVIFVSVSS